MEVFVLSEEWYHDNGLIIGVFKTKEDAIEGFKQYITSVNNGLYDKNLRTMKNYDYKLTCYDDHDYEQKDETWYMIHKFRLNQINPTNS